MKTLKKVSSEKSPHLKVATLLFSSWYMSNSLLRGNITVNVGFLAAFLASSHLKVASLLFSSCYMGNSLLRGNVTVNVGFLAAFLVSMD